MIKRGGRSLTVIPSTPFSHSSLSSCQTPSLPRGGWTPPRFSRAALEGDLHLFRVFLEKRDRGNRQIATAAIAIGGERTGALTMTEAPATMEAPATIEEAKEAWRVFIAEANKKKKPGPKKGSKQRKNGVSRAIESESGGEVLYACSECTEPGGVGKPREAFHKDEAKLDGIAYVCIACCSEQAKCDRKTPRGIIGTLCWNAIANSKARATKEGRPKMLQYDIPGTIKKQIPWIKNKAGESPRPRCRSPRPR